MVVKSISEEKKPTDIKLEKSLGFSIQNEKKGGKNSFFFLVTVLLKTKPLIRENAKAAVIDIKKKTDLG